MTATLAVLQEDDRPAARPDPVTEKEAETGPELSYRVGYIPDSARFGRSAKNAPIVVTITASEAALPHLVTRELLGVYTTDGWDGVANLASGVFGLDDYSTFIMADGLHQKSAAGPLAGDERIEAMDGAVADDRRPLWDAFTAARRQLKERVRSAERVIEASALVVAHSRLAECRELVLSEAVRYLSLSDPRERSARLVLAGGHQDALAQSRSGGLAGPDGPALMAQLRSLLPAKRSLTALRAVLLADKAIDAASPHAPLVFPTLFPYAALVQRARQATGIPDRNSAAAVAQAATVASHAFTAVFCAAATGFPILTRLIGEDTDDPRSVAMATTEILQGAWAAGKELETELTADPTKVWQMPQLIDLAVTRTLGGDGEFAERVAADALVAHGAKLSICEIFNAAVQGVDTALIAVPIPAVTLGMTLLSLIAGAAEVMDTYLRDQVPRHADRAAIDPSLALGNAPSFLGLAVHAGLLALCVLPIPGLAAEIKAARLKPALPI